MNTDNLAKAKREITLIDYIPGKKIKAGTNIFRVNPCPVCGGKDHFTIYPDKNTYSSFNGCCKGGTIIDYLIEIEKLEKNQAIQRVLEMAGYDSNFKNERKVIHMKTMEKPISNTVESNIDIDLTQSLYNHYIKNNDEDRRYFFNRGLSSEVIEKYNLVVADPREVLQDNIGLLPKLPNINFYEYILPIWENDKVVSLIGRRNDSKSIDNSKTFNLKGVPQKIFNLDLLKSTKQIIFITEAIFDTLSIESLGNYNSISLNSVVMANRFLEAVKANLKTCIDKTFVLCGDNDKAGEDLNRKLKEGLNKLQIDTKILSLNNFKDVNEFLLSDKESLKDNISIIIESITNKESGFDYLANFFEDDIKKLSSYQLKSTGFRNLDTCLNGGLYAGLYVVGGVSSLGKTTFIHQMADNVAKQGNKVIFFSLEQSKMELISKSLSRETFKTDHKEALTAKKIMYGTITNTLRESITNYLEPSKNIKILEGNFDTTVKTIRKYIENHISMNEDNPLVIVDYLQIIQSIDFKMSDKQKIDTTVTELKRISRDYNIPLIVISSLNRDSYLNPISFESFKESGGIEYTADIVLGLQYRNISIIADEKNKTKQRSLLKEEALKEPREIELVCLKQRNGTQIFNCTYDFNPQFNFFNETSKGVF